MFDRGKKEKLLLHSCCAPCSIYVINQLTEKFDLAVYFFNPNIYPEEEYLLRLAEVKNYCRQRKIPYYDQNYNNQQWLKYISGYETEPEKGFRCELCIRHRLNQTAKFARENDFQWFATTLTSGRKKNSLQILKIGHKIENKQGVKFLAQDFKKNYGTQISDWLAKQLDLYKQKYCGCVFSKKV